MYTIHLHLGKTPVKHTMQLQVYTIKEVDKRNLEHSAYTHNNMKS